MKNTQPIATCDELFDKVSKLAKENELKKLEFNIKYIYLSTEYDEEEWNAEYTYIIIVLSNWERIGFDYNEVLKLSDNVINYNLFDENKQKELLKLENSLKKWNWVILLNDYKNSEWKLLINSAIIFNKTSLYERIISAFIMKNPEINQEKIRKKITKELDKYFEENIINDWSKLLTYLYNETRNTTK